MKTIIEFFNKYGMLIITFFVFLIFINTCGTKTINEKNGKRIDKVERSIQQIDSTMSTKISGRRLEKLLKKNLLLTAKEILYSNNTIILTKARPEPLMMQYDKQAQEIDEELKLIK